MVFRAGKVNAQHVIGNAPGNAQHVIGNVPGNAQHVISNVPGNAHLLPHIATLCHWARQTCPQPAYASMVFRAGKVNAR